MLLLIKNAYSLLTSNLKIKLLYKIEPIENE